VAMEWSTSAFSAMRCWITDDLGLTECRSGTKNAAMNQFAKP
jgi:hypothetical protein